MDAATADGVIKRFMQFENQQLAVIGPWSHGAGLHALWGLVLTVASVSACLAASRAGGRTAARQRRRVDQVASYLAGELYQREVAMPTRRRRSRS